MKFNKIKLLLLSLIVLFLSTFVYISYSIGNTKFNYIRSLLSYEQKQFLKRYFFPYKFISEQDKTISKLSMLNPSFSELKFKKNLTNIQILKNLTLSNGMYLERFKLYGGFYTGTKGYKSGYIDFFEDNMFILSSHGVLAFKKNLINGGSNFKQIKNNINEFIGIDQFKKSKSATLKDILVFKDFIFISYTEEVKENCWNTSVIYGDINFIKIKFKKIFSPEECTYLDIHESHHVGQAGGRIVKFDDNNILLSIGDYRTRHRAQEKKSVNGKVIKININNSEYEIISMGHRNPQGLYFDEENNFILESEHGPLGGDEINLIEVEKINKDVIQNYGWPMVSAGEHYGGKNAIKNIKVYEKFPLYKSHTKYGFIEPLKSFVPAIAPSEIVKIGKNKYVLGSMGKDGLSETEGNKSLIFFELTDQKKIINLEKVKVFERVRDLKFHDNKLYLFMENTASIGIISLK